MNKKAIFESQKHVFWTALILAAFVFASGIFMGFMLENSRTEKVNSILASAELKLLDARIQNDIYSFSDINCEKAIGENIVFADSIYEEARILDKYEQSNELSDDIVLQHKKYDLLRVLFWTNAVKIKEKCNASYHNIVYVYDYNKPRLDIKAKQAVFAKILSDVKSSRGSEIMLIPFAGDNDVSSINLLMDLYNISESELPVILIDEKIKVVNIEKPADIESYLD